MIIKDRLYEFFEYKKSNKKKNTCPTEVKNLTDAILCIRINLTNTTLGRW